MAVVSARGVNLVDQYSTPSNEYTQGTISGLGRRVAINSSGTVYAYLFGQGAAAGAVVKWPTPGDNSAQTLYTASGNLTAPSFPRSVACDMGSDDVLHIVYVTFSGSTITVYHKKFNTTTDAYIAGETSVHSLTGVNSSQHTVDIYVDEDNEVHVALGLQTAIGPSVHKLFYAKTTAGVWGAVQTVISSQSSSPIYAVRLNVDVGGRVLILNSSSGAWTGYEDTDGDGTWTGTALTGVGQAEIISTNDGARHILFAGDKRHSIVKGPLSSLTSTLGAIKFENPFTDGGVEATGLSNDTYLNPGIVCATDGDVIYVLSSANGLLYQGQYKSGIWSFLRSIDTLDVGYASVISVSIAKSLTSDGHLAALVRPLLTLGNSNRSILYYINKDTPPRAGVTHDIVIDGEGYMLQGVLQKADISNTIPRISITGELRSEDNLSDLSSSTQDSWHHGRGDRVFANPFAFTDSDNLLTHIPNQVTPPYAEVATEDLDGYPVDMTLYQGNLYALIYGNAAANNSLQVWDNTNTERDAVAAGLDTATGVPSDLEIYIQDLWVAQGDTVASRVYDFSTTTWVTGTVPAYCFKEWDGKLWRGDNY